MLPRELRNFTFQKMIVNYNLGRVDQSHLPDKL